MRDDTEFYRAFEERYRGSRESIKQRLSAYRPFLEPLLEAGVGSKVIDLGCGRGEWLELTTDLGFEPVGVDVDAGMLDAAKAQGLKVEQADAIEFLKNQPDSSVAVVSGFHIAEHLPFHVLQELVRQAHRVLASGGLLILETPNPENLTVGAESFYLDPTHERPLPPGLLSFLPEYYGFRRQRVLRLQEPEWLKQERQAVRLQDVFVGVSPDYAVVAQKACSQQLSNLLDEAFSEECGLTLATLSDEYDETINSALARNTERIERALVELEQLKTRTVAAEDLLGAVYASRSWRITAPLRWTTRQFQLVRQHGLKTRCKVLARKAATPLLSSAVTFVKNKPFLRRFSVSLLRRLGLYARVQRLYHGGSFYSSTGNHGQPFEKYQRAPETLEGLSPDARQAYFKLRMAMDQKTDSKRNQA